MTGVACPKLNMMETTYYYRHRDIAWILDPTRVSCSIGEMPSNMLRR